MRKIYLAVTLIAGLFATAAEAANFSAKDASAATIIFNNPGNCTTGCTPIFSWADSTGVNLVAVLTAGADGASNTATGGLTYGRNLVFNGTTWDRWTGAVSQSGTWNINNISGTISLPTGAATASKQPALGTAGSPSADVISVQGVASGTPQPVSVASGAAVDGWSATDGTKADAPATLPATTASASEVALLKAIANAANAPAQLAVNTTPTDCSGSITTGGTAQSAIAAQTTLHGFTIANVDSAHNDEVLWISFTTTAAAQTAGSYPLPPPTATTFAAFGSYTTPPGFGTNHAVSIIGATTGHVFSCTWW